MRLWTWINGTPLHNDYTYTEATVAAAAIMSPAPSSTLTSASTTFTWNAATGATAYYLWVGTTPGGYDLANVSPTPLTGTSVNVTLPTNGATDLRAPLDVDQRHPAPQRLHLHRGHCRCSRDHEPGAQQHVDLGFNHLYLERCDGRERLLSLDWHHPRGLRPGQRQSYAPHRHQRECYAAHQRSHRSTCASGRGSTATPLHNDYTYTEATVAAAAIMSPAPSSTLTSASTTFSWNAATGATAYFLWIGTTPGGYDLANVSPTPLTGTSVNVTLPTNGATIYVRLWTWINGTPLHNDYTYIDATP